MEIQNQDFHFSTAQNRLRRKEKNCRSHKPLDTPILNCLSWRFTSLCGGILRLGRANDSYCDAPQHSRFALRELAVFYRMQIRSYVHWESSLRLPAARQIDDGQ